MRKVGVSIFDKSDYSKLLTLSLRYIRIKVKIEIEITYTIIELNRIEIDVIISIPAVTKFQINAGKNVSFSLIQLPRASNQVIHRPCFEQSNNVLSLERSNGKYR